MNAVNVVKYILLLLSELTLSGLFYILQFLNIVKLNLADQSSIVKYNFILNISNYGSVIFGIMFMITLAIGIIRLITYLDKNHKMQKETTD